MAPTHKLAALLFSFVALAHCKPAPFHSSLVSRQDNGNATFATSGGNVTIPTSSGDQTIRNDIIDGPCKPVSLVFARGTLEDGNVGIITGPLFFDALDKLMPGQLAVQGVDNYPANVTEYLNGGSDTGAANMSAIATEAIKKCPDTKLVLSGYSQGAQVTHKAAKLMSAEVLSKVKAVVVFGDPDKGQAFPTGICPKRVITFCHDGDLICDGEPDIEEPHLTYGTLDSGNAAKQVQALLNK